MHTVKCRVYDTDDEGRRFLLYRPGDVVTDEDAKRIATLSKPDETPALPLGRMKLDELRDVCDAEAVETDGLNTRSDFRHAI